MENKIVFLYCFHLNAENMKDTRLSLKLDFTSLDDCICAINKYAINEMSELKLDASSKLSYLQNLLLLDRAFKIRCHRSTFRFQSYYLKQPCAVETNRYLNCRHPHRLRQCRNFRH